MTWKIEWKLICDHCRKISKMREPRSVKIEKQVRRWGWVFTAACHLCPACGKNHKIRLLFEKESK